MNLPVILCVVSQFLQKAPVAPPPPAVLRVQEQTLRYRIDRLPDHAPNGWEVVAEAAEQLPKFEKPVLVDFMAALSGKPFDRASLEKIAAHADFSRATIRKALERKGWQSRPWDPPDYFIHQSAPGASLPQIIRPILARLVAPAENLTAEEALEDLNLLLQVSGTAQRKAVRLADGLQGMAAGILIDSAVVRLLANDRFEPAQLGTLAAMLARSPRSPADFREAFRHEIAAHRRLIDSGYAGWESVVSAGNENPPKSNLLIKVLWPAVVDPARCRQWIDTLGTEFVNGLGAPFTADGHPGFRTLRAWRKPVSDMDWLRGNSLGESVVASSMRSYEKIMPSIAVTQSTRGMVSVAVALRRWEREQGPGLPAGLTQLVPHYLPALPVDFMDGKPLRYNRDKRIVYSIGKDLIDNIPDVPDSPAVVAGDGNAVLLMPALKRAEPRDSQ